MDYKSLLNDEQIEPVLDTEGAVLVLAGAGSGKTRVLTYRVAYLLDVLKVPSFNILAITFTNKAANEMKERVSQVTGNNDIWISTFHSFCAKILRYEIQHIGYDSNFSIFTASDSQKVVNRILKSYDIDDNDLKKNIRWHISNCKNLGLTIDAYYNNLTDNNADLIKKVMVKYEEELFKCNALDFDDLLLKTVQLFAKNKEVLEKYQERFKYIHVDEFQDTNKIQMLLVRMLANKHGNIFVVGDDDQSIYGWRGAEVENILKFNKCFPSVKIYKLQRNYRSTDKIIECANKVISHNTSRMGKELWTDCKNGMKVVYKNQYDDKAEADYVLSEIKALVRNNGYKYSDFAILVRINALTRVFEEKMNLYGIKYKLIGGFKFYDRKEILDTIAYLRVISNPKDAESIVRIINFPKRGIGDTAVAKLMDYCNTHNITFYEGIMGIEDNAELTNLIKKKFITFRDLLIDLQTAYREKSFIELVEFMLERVDFYSVYDMDNTEDRNKLENIDELVTVIKEYCKDNPDATLNDFLQSVALISDNDVEDNDDFITIATVHGVKGLEYRCVFIVGCEENIFPSSRVYMSNTELEEERRCMYVAITRAKERLYLTSATTRFRFGKFENNYVSRFVKEAGLIEEEPKREENKYQQLKYENIASWAKSNKIQNNIIKNDIEKDLSGFVVGAKVRHSRFGEGKIVSRSGDSAVVAFPTLGNKNFNLLLAPMELID